MNPGQWAGKTVTRNMPGVPSNYTYTCAECPNTTTPDCSSFPPRLAIVQGRLRVRPQLGLHFVGLRRHSSHVPAALELLIRVNNDSIVKLFL